MNYIKQLFFLVLLVVTTGAIAQNVGIGTGNPHSSAVLDITSASKGLLLPRVVDTLNVNAPFFSAMSPSGDIAFYFMIISS